MHSNVDQLPLENLVLDADFCHSCSPTVSFSLALVSFAKPVIAKDNSVKIKCLRQVVSFYLQTPLKLQSGEVNNIYYSINAASKLLLVSIN